MDALLSALGRNGYLPHGVCFTWSPGLLWTMVTADALIALSYFSIPLAIGRFLRLRDVGIYRHLGWLFGAFILACGLTHVMDIWTVWQPDYALQAMTKGLTAAVSVLTAVMLWPLIPRAMKIPSVFELQAAIGALEAEVARRRTAEQHANDSEQSLALTLSSIEAGFIAADRQGHVTRMNAVAERVTGWRQSEARGRPVWDVFAREGRPPEMMLRNPVDLMIERGVTIEQAHLVTALARDGRATPVEVKASLTRADDGSVRGLLMVFRDMSRLARAEADAQRLAAIVQSSSDAIIGKTLDGRITSWNAAAETLFGWSAVEAIGQPVQMLIPPGRIDEEMRILANLAHGRVVPAFDTQRRTRDGRLVDVSVTISPIRDAAGRIIGGSKIARDNSLQRALEAGRLRVERLEAENRQILQANRVKSQFLANVSHELRTPLNAVIGFADLLQSGAVPHDSPKHRSFLGHIAGSGRHLLQLINDVLDLSKVEAGKLDFHPEPVDLSRTVGDLVDLLNADVQRKRIQLVLEIDASLADLHLDPVRLKQVFYNYLSNAIKFTPEGGRVTLRARPEGLLQFRIEVEDTGIGIAAEDIPRLFVEFQQLDAGYAKRHSGTGLGLALTRRLVQAQGGTVGVRSAPGEGSVFHAVLWRRHADAPQTAANALRRVLVIESDLQLQARWLRALDEAGFGADTAATAVQALAQARLLPYDAITLELQLRGEPGLAALASIRSEGPSRGSPVVGMSMPAPPAGSATFAVADVLSKPIRGDEVVSAMARLPRPADRALRVLVIDDDPTALDLMAATLATIGVETVCRMDGRQALVEIEQHWPDAIVLDLMMPGFDGFAVLDALLRMPAWRATPVYIWTSMVLTDDEYALLAESARAIIHKGGGQLSAVLDGLRRLRPTIAGATRSEP